MVLANAQHAATTVTYTVYQLTCVDTGRVYVGFTKDPSRRYLQHKASPPPRMRVDASRYTPWEEHFVMAVLESGIRTRVKAKQREALYIERMGTCSRVNGYNEAPGSTTRAFWYRLRRGKLAR